jgi:hypothetical protein
LAASGIRGGESLIHDAPNGSGAPAALWAAAEATVYLTCRPRRRRIVCQRATNIVVGQHIAGTDNHGRPDQIDWYQVQLSHLGRAEVDFNQNRISLEQF